MYRGHGDGRRELDLFLFDLRLPEHRRHPRAPLLHRRPTSSRCSLSPTATTKRSKSSRQKQVENYLLKTKKVKTKLIYILGNFLILIPPLIIYFPAIFFQRFIFNCQIKVRFKTKIFRNPVAFKSPKNKSKSFKSEQYYIIKLFIANTRFAKRPYLKFQFNKHFSKNIMYKLKTLIYINQI